MQVNNSEKSLPRDKTVERIVRISVIMPVYNAQRFIRECIDSVLTQSFGDFELICVDQGSTDASSQIIAGYASQDPRIIVVNPQNPHTGITLNQGMAIARGEYITLIEADGKFTPDALEKFYEKAKETGADVVIADTIAWDAIDGGSYLGDRGANRQYLPDKAMFSKEDIPKYILTLSSSNPWGKLFSNDLIKKFDLEFLDLKHAEDFYFVYLAFIRAECIATLAHPIIYYRVYNFGGLEANKTEAPLVFWEANCRLKEKLMADGLFDDATKQSLINSLLIQFQYNFRTIKTVNGYMEIYNLLKRIYITELELNQHPEEYFFVMDPNIFIKMAEAPSADAFIPSGIIRNRDLKRKHIIGIEDGTESEKLNAVKVSVIIPIYNTAAYLYQAISSIINQSLKEIEIICVNDGSTDNSQELMEEFCEIDDRIILINQSNGKQSLARNNGFSYASGKYVYFFDSDDILEKEALKTLFYYAEAKDLQLLLFDGKSFYDSNILKIKYPHYAKAYQRKGQYLDIYTGPELFCDLIRNGDYTVSPCLQLIKRDYLLEQDISFRVGIYHEDNLFSYQVLLSAQRVGHINKTFFNRRVRENSTITYNNKLDDYTGLYTCLVAMTVYTAQLKLPPETLRHVRNHLNEFHNIILNRFKELPIKHRNEPRFADPLEHAISILIFKSFGSGGAFINTNDRMINAGSQKNEIDSIHASWTYKIGRFITFVPRKIRGGIKCCQEHGIAYTILRTKEKLLHP